MKKDTIWLLIIFIILALSAWLSNYHLFQQPVRNTSNLTKNIPAKLGPWYLVRESKPLKAEYDGLETTDIIKRTYSNGEKAIHLILAYIAHSNRKSAHAQEACLRGAGAQVGLLETRSLQNLPITATIINISHGGQDILVYYWYKIGKLYTSKYLKSSVLMFLGGIIGKEKKGAALIRISTALNKLEPPDAAHTRIKTFTQALLPALEATLP